MDKLYYLKFPIYGLRFKPIVREEEDKLFIKKRAACKEVLIDDKSLPNSEYVQRYAQLPSSWKCIFCENIDSLIFNDIRWGLDKYGKVHTNLFISQNSKSDRQHHLFKKHVPIVKHFQNSIWFEGMKDPVVLPVDIKASLKGIYADLVLAGGAWRLKNLYHMDIRNRKVSFK